MAPESKQVLPLVALQPGPPVNPGVRKLAPPPMNCEVAVFEPQTAPATLSGTQLWFASRQALAPGSECRLSAYPTHNLKVSVPALNVPSSTHSLASLLVNPRSSFPPRLRTWFPGGGPALGLAEAE